MGWVVAMVKTEVGEGPSVGARACLVGEGDEDGGGEDGVGGQPGGDLEEVADGVERRHVCDTMIRGKVG